MTVAIVDTTVIVHLFRNYEPALTWYSSISQGLGVTTINWLEVMYGASSKAKQTTCKTMLDQFEVFYLTQADQNWAMEQMERFRLSHGVTLADRLIAAVAYRLQVTLYTQNLKDMVPIIGELASKPYN